MAELNEFYLDASPSAAMLECIEISHSLWPQSLRYVLNHTDGVTVTHEDGLVVVYEFMPLQIRRGGAFNDLDQTLDITVNDLGQIVPRLLKIIRNADTEESPAVVYRAYSSVNLDSPLRVIDGFFVEERSTNEEATTFKAATKRANSNGTGLMYTLDEFPSLRSLF
ncbi:DUF1833 domain-containing protein [Acinetobacter chinensis]|uniref:DUF1833 domain-containing protein n=1 Tax=Acinetobacter chinensis TaxID=2004650 RepID=A0A3B7LVL7_9GAMM|nr:DUF1833 family protein [Acinetobacter chinensis]AXY56802.1 DUF1833 domain-containing protein [Acinetobacter chinensis]